MKKYKISRVCWARIIEKTAAVVFCREIGEVIVPESILQYSECSALPHNKDILISTVYCLRYICRRAGGNGTCVKLRHDLYWRYERDLFSGECQHPCMGIQKLVSSKPSTAKSLPDDIPPDGAIIFGDIPKTLKKPKTQ
jgi:hypothetical protein